MDLSTLIMLAAAGVFLVAVYVKSPESANRSLEATAGLVLEILPRMAAAFIIAGLVQGIVPQDTLVQWMGQGSGSRGILIGMILGTITPGGPMMHFPIVASFYKVGVGIGPLVALSDRVVAFRHAAPYYVGAALSRDSCRCDARGGQSFLPVSCGLVIQSCVGKISPLITACEAA